MAKKFTFGLDPVLKLKEQKTLEARNFLNHATRKRLETEEQIREILRSRSEMSSGKVVSAKASDMQAKLNRMKFLDDEIKKLESERKELIDIESVRRKKLNNALKDEKAIVKLKDKKIDEHRDSLKKEENDFIDELVINKENKKLRD